MICLAVRMTVKAGSEKEVTASFVKLTEKSRKEPGCAMYVAHQHQDDPRRFLVYEQYKDAAALEYHRKTLSFL